MSVAERQLERIVSMRAEFAREIHKRMAAEENIFVITGDLGYRVWDQIRKDFPDRFVNVGAAEQALVGISVGLALKGKIPFVYSITPFLLYRPFETIRNYLNHEEIPVRLVGSGRDRDYFHDGFSHWSQEDRMVMAIMKNIRSRWPETTDEIPQLVDEMVRINKPWYINLKR